jgi:hypothetical protein
MHRLEYLLEAEECLVLVARAVDRNERLRHCRSAGSGVTSQRTSDEINLHDMRLGGY